MAIADRSELFGDPSETLAAEAVWAHHEEEGAWPFWEEAVVRIARLAHCDEDAAEVRLLTAILDDEVTPRVRAGGRAWRLEVDPATADRIARRYMDLTMPRRDQEEAW